MKINNIKLVNYTNKKQYNLKDHNYIISNQLTQNKTEINYRHLQTYNNINFKGTSSSAIYIPEYDPKGAIKSLFLLATFKDKYSWLKINEKEYIDIFADKNGNPKTKELLQFLNLYKDKMESEIKNTQRNIEYYENLSKGYIDDYSHLDQYIDNEYSENQYETSEEDLEDESEFLSDLENLLEDDDAQEIFAEMLASNKLDILETKELIESLSNQDMIKELAEKILDIHKKTTIRDISRTSQNFSINYMYLSKTQNDFNFGRYSQKAEIIKTISNLENEYRDENLFQTIIKSSKDNFDKIDLNFIETLAKVCENYEMCTIPTQQIGKIIADFEKKDPENRYSIYKTIEKITKTHHIDDINFKTIFNLCFNPINNKFDKTSADLLLKLLKETEKWIDENFIDEQYASCMKHYKIAQEEIIKNYFDIARDRNTGNISPLAPEIEDFIDTQKDRYEYK